MTKGPAAGSGWDEDPARRSRGPGDPLQDEAAGWRRLPPGADWMDDEQWEASLAARRSAELLPDPKLCPDPEDPQVPGEVDLEAIYAECREISADEARAAALAARLGTTGALAAGAATAAGRRGPGMPGSAGSFPGEYPGPAGGFASGMALDAAPGCAVLALCAGDAIGEDDEALSGVTDDELIGLLCAWDRVQAHGSARKHAVAAELIRRRPAPGCALEGPARMPAAWEEFVPDELAPALAESAWAAAALLDLAWDLEVKLPGTKAAFRAGMIQENKARIIANAAQLLDPGEARVAEALVLGRAGTLTPGGLRSAIAHAVIQVAPDKARKRREQAAKDARVERWTEDSGNAALAGRELPPADVLAADQRISWWARQLRQAGLDGSMDELRARAYLDLLLGMDSRPIPQAAEGTAADGPGPQRDGAAGSGTAGPGAAGDGPDRGGPDDAGPGGGGLGDSGADSGGPDDSGPGGGGHGPGGPAPAGPAAGVIPPGFAGRVNLTIPLATLLGLADRPGQAAGIGPVDPDPGANTPNRYQSETCADRRGGSGINVPRPRDRWRRVRRTPGVRSPWCRIGHALRCPAGSPDSVRQQSATGRLGGPGR